MYLDGVAAAQTDRSAAPAIQMNEIMLRTALAIGIARGRRGLADFSGPCVDGGQAGRNRLRAQAEDFQGVASRERSDGRGDGSQHTIGLASWLNTLRRRLGVDASQACSSAGYNREFQAVAAHRGGVDPGDSRADRIVIDQ